MFLLRILFLNFVFAIFICKGQEICHVQGQCESGVQIGETTSESYEDCQDICQETQFCNFFTYFEPNSFCKLLYNCSGIETSTCSECYTGQRDCSVAICSEPGSCLGGFVADSFLDSEYECLESCANNAECLWYTFNFDLNYCLLTSSCIPQSSNSHLYGQRECYQDNNNNSSNPSKFQVIFHHNHRYYVNVLGLYTKLMVVGGFEYAAGKVELVDLSGQKLKCPNITDFPISYGSVGTFINDKALVCGGFSGESTYHNECYSYNKNVT